VLLITPPFEAVTFVVPAATGLITPLEFTVAIEVSLEAQVKVGAGVIVLPF
jgi:hypothetical protein